MYKHILCYVSLVLNYNIVNTAGHLTSSSPLTAITHLFFIFWKVVEMYEENWNIIILLWSLMRIPHSKPEMWKPSIPLVLIKLQMVCCSDLLSHPAWPCYQCLWRLVLQCLKFSFSSENLEQESHVYYLHRPVNFFIRIFVPVSYLNYGIKWKRVECCTFAFVNLSDL